MAYRGVAYGGEDVAGVEPAQGVHRLQRAAKSLVEDVADASPPTSGKAD